MARLPIEVDSSQVARAAVDLDALEAAALSAGYAVESLADHTRHQTFESELLEQQINSEIAALLRQNGVVQQTAHSTVEATQAMHGLRFGVANVAAQFQDIAVTSAMGMNPLTIALQQGTQLSAAFQAQGRGIAGVGVMLREAFASVISPVSLVTIGVVAATAATVQWTAANVKWGKSSADMLDEFYDKLQKVTSGYKGAEELVNNLRENSGRLSIGAIEVTLGKSLTDAEKDMESFRRGAANTAAAFRTSGREIDAAFADTIDAFLRGEISADKFETEVAKAAATNITFFSSFDDVQLQRFAAQLLEGAKVAKVFEDSLVDISHILASVGENSEVKFALDAMVESDRAAIGHQLEMDAIYAKSPAQLADIARRRESIALIDEEISETERKNRVDAAGAEAYAAAAFEVGEANRARLRSARDNIAQSELELRLVGRGIEETTRLRFVREELAAAEEEAAANGVSVSQEYVQAIEQIGEEYGRLERQVAEKGAISDLLFARSQMGVSETEANVASALREIYGDDFAAHMDGFLARQIRINDQLAIWDDLGEQAASNILIGFKDAFQKAYLDSEEDFASLRLGYATDLLAEAQARGTEITESQRLEIVRLSLAMAEAEDGASRLERMWTSAWEGMLDVSSRVLDQIANKALGMAANGIWDMVFGAVTGMIGGNSLGGGWGVAGAMGRPGIFGIPGFADGVDHAPAGVAWVGERGPELLNFRGGESVSPVTTAAGAAPITTIFQIDAPGAQLGFEQRFADMMDSWARSNWSLYSSMFAENNTRQGT